MRRRKFLELAGVGSVAATAGCIGPLSNNESTGEPFSHPSTVDLDTQPYIGPEPSTDNPVMIAFEDLACTFCRSFHQNAYQKLKNDHIDNGNLTFVYRGTDFAGYPWSDTASLVHEAVYDQAPDRTFDAIESYYDNQDRFNSSNIIEESRDMLGDLGIDPDPVIEAVQNGSVSDNFASDKSAGRNSGVRGTPTFVILNDGIYETTVSGAKNSRVFEAVLDL